MGWGVGCRGGSVRRFGRSVGSRSIMSRGWSISGWFLCSTMYVVLVVAGSNIFVEYGSVSTVETILLSISMAEVINLNTEKRSRSGYTRIFREYMNIPCISRYTLIQGNGYILNYIQVHPDIQSISGYLDLDIGRFLI